MTIETQKAIFTLIAVLVFILMLWWMIYVVRNGYREGMVNYTSTNWEQVKWHQLKDKDDVRIYYPHGTIYFTAHEFIEGNQIVIYLLKPEDKDVSVINYYPVTEMACLGLVIERFNSKNSEVFNPLNYEQTK